MVKPPLKPSKRRRQRQEKAERYWFIYPLSGKCVKGYPYPKKRKAAK